MLINLYLLKTFFIVLLTRHLFYRSKSEGVDIHTIETIDVELEVDTPKPVKKRGRRPKIKEECLDDPICNAEAILDEVDNKDDHDKQKCTSVENLIEMLEDDDVDDDDDDDNDKDNDEGTTNDMEEICSQKMIQPGDIKQEAIHPELENIDEDDDDLDDSPLLEEDDSDYDENDDSKNGNESSSPKKTKVTKHSMKKKTPEILIPQMVNFKMHLILYGYM